MIIGDKNERGMASHVANILLDYGMLYGAELESYIKLAVKDYHEFENDEHYLAFESLVFEYIEERKDYFKVKDITTNKHFKFASVNSIVSEFNITRTKVHKALSKGITLNDRYEMTSVTKKAHEL